MPGWVLLVLVIVSVLLAMASTRVGRGGRFDQHRRDDDGEV